jgi:hypothetical protein
MFTDWITASFGYIKQYQVRGTLFEHIRVLKRIYPKVFTRTTFGSLSVCLPGQHWQSVEEEAGFSLVDDILHWCATAHISRFDLAHDWSLEKIDSDKIWSAIAELPSITRLEGPGGRTWYIGSRESDRFARLYDKTAEIFAKTGVRVDFPILRFEVELKGRTAAEYFSHFRRSRDVVQSDIAQRYNLIEFLHGTSTDVIRVAGLPQADPFAFIRQFQRAITKARKADPRLFDELIPAPVTALPPVAQ